MCESIIPFIQLYFVFYRLVNTDVWTVKIILTQSLTVHKHKENRINSKRWIVQAQGGTFGIPYSHLASENLKNVQELTFVPSADRYRRSRTSGKGSAWRLAYTLRRKKEVSYFWPCNLWKCFENGKKMTLPPPHLYPPTIAEPCFTKHANSFCLWYRYSCRRRSGMWTLCDL